MPNPEVKVVRPFNGKIFNDLQNHIAQVRRCFDWPGVDLHDKDHAESDRFNRWFWHNLPLLVKLHNSPDFIKLASKLFGQDLKPSYVFLSLYSPEGVCPKHTDRPQCQFTIDLLVNSNHRDKPWPINIAGQDFVAKPGEAVAYSGTGQEHYRLPMKEASDATKVDLAFFHFVPVEWQGKLS